MSIAELAEIHSSATTMQDSSSHLRLIYIQLGEHSTLVNLDMARMSTHRARLKGSTSTITSMELVETVTYRKYIFNFLIYVCSCRATNGGFYPVKSVAEY